MPIVVLASGAGTLLTSILRRAERSSSPYRVAGVVVDRECAAERIAAEAEIPVARCVVRDHSDREAWDRALAVQVADFAPEWVVTAGFMKILGPHMLTGFRDRIVNSHPALLPAFPGAHGVADAVAYGVKVTGCTVHLVDGGVDSGPILAQRTVEVTADDTVDTLHERIKTVERDLLPDVVEALVTRGVVTDGRKAHFK